MEISGSVLWAQNNSALTETRARYLARLAGIKRWGTGQQQRKGRNRNQARRGSVRNPLQGVPRSLLDTETTLRADRPDGTPIRRVLANDLHLCHVVASAEYLADTLADDRESNANWAHDTISVKWQARLNHAITEQLPGEFVPARTVATDHTYQPAQSAAPTICGKAPATTGEVIRQCATTIYDTIASALLVTLDRPTKPALVAAEIFGSWFACEATQRGLVAVKRFEDGKYTSAWLRAVKYVNAE